jgi:hypothetical protein
MTRSILPDGSTGRTGSTVYVAPLVHSLSLDDLDVSALSAFSVNEDGIIEWVERLDASQSRDEQMKAVTQVLAIKEQAEVHGDLVWIEEGFICPGLIDTHTVRSPC